MEPITMKSIEQIEPYRGPHVIPGIRFRAAGPALGVSSWGMSVIELDPHNAGYPQHDHADDGHEDVYFVVRGSAYIRVDGEEHALSAGTFVRVPGAATRKIVTRDEGATILALGGTPGKPYSPSRGRPR